MSLQNDYEVTGKELDMLVHSFLAQEGCVGARMTGAGFGGGIWPADRDISGGRPGGRDDFMPVWKRSEGGGYSAGSPEGWVLL